MHLITISMALGLLYNVHRNDEYFKKELGSARVMGFYDLLFISAQCSVLYFYSVGRVSTMCVSRV